MNFFKLLNIQSNKQKKLILEDKKKILNYCNDIAIKEYREQAIEEKEHNENCPKCHANKTNIVDKISNVNGIGNVNGTLFGGTYGSVNIKTELINHCNVCGNEWHKFKVKYVSATDILKVALRYLDNIISDPTEKRYEWKVQTIKVFDDCYFETILKLKKEHKHISGFNHLTLFNLKKYYKSVFDEEQ